MVRKTPEQTPDSLALSAVSERFILHWGEMGTRWGINRSVAQIHALLFLAKRPLNAEEITRTLSLARSNVSTSLRELMSWGIVSVVHVLGDRRDHFESRRGVWELFQTILEERKRREIDPTVALLKSCTDEARRQGDEHCEARLGELLEFFDTMTEWYESVRHLSPQKARKLLNIGTKVGKFIP